MKHLTKKISAVIILSVLSSNLIGTTSKYAFASESNISLAASSTSSDSIQFVRNTTPWVVDNNVNFSAYDFLGRGEDLNKKLKKEYPEYSISYFYNSNNTQVTEYEFNTLVNIMAKYTIDTNKKTINITYDRIDIRVLPEYTSVSGQEGTSFTIKFTANLPTIYYLNIGNYMDKDGISNFGSIVPKGSDGTYTASVTMTIPYVENHSGNYYINFRCDCGNAGSPWITSIPISITPGNDLGNHHLYCTGYWDSVSSDSYKQNVKKYFYSQYPRLYKRWNTGPQSITFNATEEEGVAWWNGLWVSVNVDFANGDPDNYGYFVHELTHATQNYKSNNVPTLVYPDGSKTEWWTEGMADYGRFRYFQWEVKDQIRNYDFNYSDMAKVSYNNDGSVYRFDWLGRAGTEDNGGVDKIHWFFAWMDYNYPTTKDSNGNIKYGLIDTIHYALSDGTYNDNIFVEKTGYTMFELMEKYTKDVNENGWRFTGFGNFPDNWVTENIEGLENPVYPSKECEGSSLSEYFDKVIDAPEGYPNEDAKNLFDNNVDTKYCTNNKSPYVVFAMKQPVNVKSYAFATGNDTSIYTDRNPKSWKIYGSNDQVSWKVIDSIENSNITLQTVDKKYFRYTMNNTESYKYYKLEMEPSTSEALVQFSEFSLYGEPNLNYCFDSVLEATQGFSNQGAEKLFDGSVDTKYCTDKSNPSIMFAMKQPVTVKYYGFTTGDDTSMYKGRNPESWILYGSNDRSNWIPIDSVAKGSDTLKAVDKKTFKFVTNNSEKYKYYKLEILSCLSGSTVQLSEFSIYGDAPSDN